jgi:two-component system nitrate/nitrite response regulator NarL
MIELMPSGISLLLVEDNRLLRDGIAAMLREQPDFTVEACTPEWNTVLRLLRERKPQIVLLDCCLGEDNSLRLLESIRAESPKVRVIVMDLIPEPEDIVEFVEIGCSGFLLKDASVEDFVSTIRSVARGVRVLPPALAGTIFAHVARHAIRKDPGAIREALAMTPREREVVLLIGDGLSNKEIAERLGIAIHTAKSHVHNILEKLALRTRLQVAAYAHQEQQTSRLHPAISLSPQP